MADRDSDNRILGSLRSENGTAVVRMEDRCDTDAADLWSALTEPGRLSHWIAEVSGDLRPGGEFRARFLVSGWEGTGHVEVCEPPRRFVVITQETGAERQGRIEATLTPNGEQTTLVIEERGMPLEQLSAYGAGWQIHVEDLSAYLAGGERCDGQARWEQLAPFYAELAPGSPDTAG